MRQLSSTILRHKIYSYSISKMEGRSFNDNDERMRYDCIINFMCDDLLKLIVLCSERKFLKNLWKCNFWGEREIYGAKFMENF